jgi:exopolyphosphatase/guanosine-5'-triphosphate,3'-diphosphate pyrophosphatase
VANTDTTVNSPVAAIDLGSNTTLVLVLDASGEVLLERSRVTRLGRGVFENGRLDPTAAEHTRTAVEEFAAAARALGAEPIVAVGTEALRRAADGVEFLESLVGGGMVDRVRLLSGEDEARYAVASHVGNVGETPFTVIDVGGGSTEVIQTSGTDSTQVIHSVSLPLGSVRLTESCVRRDPPDRADFERLAAAIDPALRELAPFALAPAAAGSVIAVAGTATTLAALDLELERWDAGRVEGHELRMADLESWLARLSELPLVERRALPGMEPGRADVMVAGLAVLRAVCAELGAAGLRVSSRGVRHGVARELLAAVGAV